jgi:hypothetical protein
MLEEYIDEGNADDVRYWPELSSPRMGQLSLCSGRDDIPQYPKKSDSPHSLLRQPFGSHLCLLYAVLNTFRSMREACKFLDCNYEEGKKIITLEDCSKFIRFCEARGWEPLDEVNWGMIRAYLQSQGKRLGVKQWTINSTKMDLNHFLLSNRDESHKTYVVSGLTSSLSDIRVNATNNIMNHESKKGKGGKRQIKKKYKKDDVLSLDGMQEEIVAGIKNKHSKAVYSLDEDDSDGHAIAIYFDERGVGWKYDPGKTKEFSIAPGKTAGSLEASITKFVESIYSVDRVHLCKIEFY